MAPKRVLAVTLFLCALAGLTASAQVLKSEFIYDTAPAAAPSCHASTIAETKSGLVVAFFGGTREGHPDVGIWLSRQIGGAWSAPAEVAKGQLDGGSPTPCWNPVLFQAPDGPLLLFYKVGPKPSSWWGMLMTSSDDGATWSKPARLPDGILGPIKDKPILLADGTLLCPSSTEGTDGWRAHVEWTKDLGKTWAKSQPMNDGKQFGLIQPTLLDHGSAGIQALMRSKQAAIVESWSTDGGMTWSPPAATKLPNPNSGIDAVQLKDGRSLLIYNPVTKGRSPVSVATSPDGKAWREPVELEQGPKEYSYPAVIQTNDGLVHVTYTWRRERVRHVVLDPAKLP